MGLPMKIQFLINWHMFLEITPCWARYPKDMWRTFLQVRSASCHLAQCRSTERGYGNSDEKCENVSCWAQIVVAMCYPAAVHFRCITFHSCFCERLIHL